jgi:hypothetical protein
MLFTKGKIETLAEIFTNLSAGWLAIVLIAPGLSTNLTTGKILDLVWNNFPPAILCFLLASRLREGVWR